MLTNAGHQTKVSIADCKCSFILQRAQSQLSYWVIRKLKNISVFYHNVLGTRPSTKNISYNF